MLFGTVIWPWLVRRARCALERREVRTMPGPLSAWRVPCQVGSPWTSTMTARKPDVPTPRRGYEPRDRLGQRP
jgi:hypothetical protein